MARFVGFELAIWSALYAAYLAVRGVTMGSPSEAFAQAWDVIRLERALGLLPESAVQQLLAPADGFFSAYYMLGFFPIVGLVTAWLALRDRAAYRALRNALLLSIAFATVVFVLFPTAPPRLVGGLAIEDTVGLASHDTGSFLGIRFNPYAAVPSMHVGWTLLVAVYAFHATRLRVLRTLFLLHLALMAVAVTATGNHFFFDCVAGVAVACVTLALLRVRRRRKYTPLRAMPPPADQTHDDPAVPKLERRAA